MPAWVEEMVVSRKGKAHVFDNLNPAATALVVVDMQNAFMMEGVAHTLCRQAQDVVPNINRLARTVRATGGAVVWIQSEFTEETLTSWSTYFESIPRERLAQRIASLTRGNKGFELWDGLDVQPGDLKVIKERYSAFIQGSSNLEQVLRERGLDTILVTGTTTDVCCESTARDGVMRNFRAIMVTDGNAAIRDEMHSASLINFYLYFGDIMPTDLLVGCLERNAAAAKPARAAS